MSQEIVPQTFENSEFGTIRAMRDANGEPWFIAKDVCDVLGVATNHLREQGRGLDDDEVSTLPNWEGKGAAPLIVSEAGLYSLVLKSRKPEAKAFRRWVTHDVLPAIRRHGAYATPEMVARSLRDPAVLIEVLDELRAEQLRSSELAEANQALAAENAEMKPKVLFADTVAASDGTCLIGELAKMMTQAGYPIGQNRLFAKLREDGYLGKSGSNRNVPLQRYVEMGLFKIKETAITHADGHVTINRTPKVTGKGQRYFIERYCRVVA